MGEIKLFRLWRSPFCRRVELALKLKGIECEMVDIDLKNKSEELLNYNPIHKKIPVLVHDGKPVMESKIVLEYLDETWKDNDNSILPSDPLERAHVRFWGSFIDDKLFPFVPRLGRSKGEELEKAKEEFEEVLMIFEKEVKGKRVDADSKIGYFEIVGLMVCYWMPVYEEAMSKQVLLREKFPGIYAWSDGLLSHPFMKENLPNREEMVASYTASYYGRD